MNLALDWLKVRRGENPAEYLDDIFRYAKARLGSREEAEDIAIEVVQALPSPCRRRDLRLYMLGMARRKVTDRIRTQAKQVQLCSLADRNFDRDVVLAACIEDVLERLEPDYREALILRHIAGLSSEEMARVMKRTPAAVNSLLQRARAAFERAWQPFSDKVEL